MSKLRLFRGFSKVIILFIWPYLCWFCRICWAYADWGLFFLMYLTCFWKRIFQATVCLTYVRQVACVVCQLINSPFFVGRNVVVFWRFDPLGYGISASECYLNVCVSEYVCDLAYLWGNVGEYYPSFVFVHVCVWCGVLCSMFYLVS